MPEKGVVKLNEREVGWEERQVPKKISRDDDQAFYGQFITHPGCCARLIGQRQTFSLHVFSPIHLPVKPAKQSLPIIAKLVTVLEMTKTLKSPETVSATATNTPCAEYVNSLNIVGRFYAKARGKELLIAICNKSTAENLGPSSFSASHLASRRTASGCRLDGTQQLLLKRRSSVEKKAGHSQSPVNTSSTQMCPVRTLHRYWALDVGTSAKAGD
ncbi:hypothetical protein DFH09DRAFT_1079728 [Mycena vulgaris]|nr:hypothetical protein DFH09DRAFT_1079728 [Mycena vulgaris]